MAAKKETEQLKKYIFIGFLDDNELHDFLMGFDNEGAWTIDVCSILVTTDQNLRKNLISLLDPEYAYAVLIQADDSAIIAWDYRILSKDDLVSDGIIDE